MKDYFEQNLAALRQKYPLVALSIHASPRAFDGTIFPTRTVPNMRVRDKKGQEIYLYNSPDPLQDAVSQLEMVEKDGAGQKCIVVGMGLGYGPIAILNNKPRINQIIILEPVIDIFRSALTANDLRPLIDSPQVTLLVGKPDWQTFRQVLSMASTDKLHLMNLYPLFEWAPDIYTPVNQHAYEIANTVSVGAATTATFGKTIIQNMFQNLTLLDHAYSIDALSGLFKEKPALIVSAGPSLNHSLPLLKEARGKCVMIAVDAAMNPLQAHGITPDFIVTLDFRDVNFEKLAPFIHDKDAPYAIVSAISATPLIAKRIPARYLFFAFEDNGSQQWICDRLGIGKKISGGSTAAHLALELSIIMGASPIIFVGQDLAYTSTESSHVKGAVFSATSTQINAEYLTEVNGIHGETLQTHRGYLAFKTVFEEIIGNHPGVYWNASAQGAHIQGTDVVPLAHVVAHTFKKNFCINDCIDAALDSVPRVDLPGLVSRGRIVLDEIQTKRSWVEKVSGQVDALKLAMSGKELGHVTCPDRLPPSINRAIIALNKYKVHAGRLDYTAQMFYQAAAEIDRRVIENQQVAALHYIDGVRDMLEIMAFENQAYLGVLDEYGRWLRGLIDHLAAVASLKNPTIPSESSVKRKLADLYCSSGDFQMARMVLDALGHKEMDDPRTMYLMGVVCSELFEFEVAFSFWEKAISLAPGMAEAIVAHRKKAAEAWFDLVLGEFGPIKQWLHRFAALAPDPEWAVNILGEQWEKKKAQIVMGIQTANSERLLDIWEPCKAFFPEWHYLKTLQLREKNMIQEGLPHLERAIELVPDNAEWLTLLSRTLIERGRFEEGLQALGQAVRIDRQSALLWEELGDVLYQQGDLTAAVMAYENCFVALPEKTDALRKLGDCYLAMGQPHAAIEAYERVLKKNGDDSIANAHLLKARQMIQSSWDR